MIRITLLVVSLFVLACGSPVADTDGDGVLDNVDNCVTIPNPMQVDTNPEIDCGVKASGYSYGNLCDPDIVAAWNSFENDGVVDVHDHAAMIDSLDKAVGEPGFNPDADLTDEFGGAPDGVVGAPDLAVLLQFYDKAPGPSGLRCP